MKICTLSSGSSGNSIFIQSNSSKVLVDCGITGKLACKLLADININPNEIDAIFVTHEHSDHIKGVGVMSRKFDIPVIANENTWMAMKNKIGKISPKNIFVFKSNTFFTFKDMDVQAVSTHHDAIDPVFFVFYNNNQKISILTDTGIVSESIVDSIKGSDIVLLESNHDIDMLENGPYPIQLKYRIKGDSGHLSNDASANFMREIVQGQGENIILGHLSKTNNTEKKAYENMKVAMEDLGIKVQNEVKLDIAKEFQVGQVKDLGGNYK